MRKLMITVDVEGQPARAERDHLDRLIFGRFPNAEEAGIGRLMDIADKHGAKLTQFVDYCERGLYGDGILDVAREIHRRGHDAQLHAHLDFLPEQFWSDRGFARELDLNRVGRDLADATFDRLCEAHVAATGVAPRAFRGGGYRFNRNILDAMVARGILLDSSVNPARKTQPIELPAQKQFRWSNGCHEVPIACLQVFLNGLQPLDFNFNAADLHSPERMLVFMDRFYELFGDDAICVLVMHSWSLLIRDRESGHFIGPSRANLERFDRFLELAARNHQFITATDYLRSPDAGGRELPISQLDGAATVAAKPSIGQPPTSPSPSAGSMPPIPANGGRAARTGEPNTTALPQLESEPICPICGTPKSRFFEREGRMCPNCKSAERQRVLAMITSYGGAPISEKGLGRMLAISPSNAERRIFSHFACDAFDSLDIRPEAKPDILADLCNMPQIADGTYDTAFGSWVMMCVHDLDAALREIRRVLKPGGLFISAEHVRYGEPSVELTDKRAMTSWYGEAAFQQHKVGTFRTLGRDAYYATLARFFHVEMIEAEDPISGMMLPVYFCRTMSETSAKPTQTAPLSPQDPLEQFPEAVLLARGEEHWAKGEFDKALPVFEAMRRRFGTQRADYRLGYAYMEGKGVPRDLDRAVTYFSSKSQQGLRYAQFYLGRIFADSTFRGYDPDRARSYLETALRLGVAEASEAIAKLPAASMAQRDALTAVPATSASRLLAAQPVPASAAIAPAPSPGDRPADPFPDLATADLVVRAEDAWANEKVPGNAERAVAMYKAAYERGESIHSPHRLGTAFYFGRGVKADIEAAYGYFSHPLLTESRFPLYYRGLILANPNFTGHDDYKALQCLERARSLGVGQAEGPIAKLLPRLRCPLCSASLARTVSDAAQPCPDCGASEVERDIAVIYREQIRFSYSVTGQRGIYIGSRERAHRYAAVFAAEISAVDPNAISQSQQVRAASADFVLACNLLRNKASAAAVLDNVARLLKPDGILLLAEATDDAQDGPEGASRTAEWLAGRHGGSHTVQRFEFREPNAGHRTRIFAVRSKRSRSHGADDARVATAIAANAAKERSANCEFSKLYDAAKAVNPALTYADFAVKREAEHVARNRNHATLGTAISERSRKQGRETFEFIKTYLEVKPDSKVVEYGCGSLRVGGHFINMLAPTRFRGLDVIRDYFDIAAAQADNTAVAEKDVRFDLIAEAGIRNAEAFGADIVYASAVLFHIHPDDIHTALSNLKRIAHRPGAKLIFDAKITRDAEPARYAQRNGRGGWAWPLWFYQAALAPLELVAQHQHSVYYFHPEVDYALLEFRMPHGISNSKIGDDATTTPAISPRPAAASTRICTICDTDCSALGKDDEICPKCRSVARARTVPLALSTVARHLEATGPLATRRALGFALPESEMRVLKKYFGEILSVSLFGTYRGDHVGGLDARDLSRFADGSFDCVFGVLLYDYFTEHDQSLADVYRILKPGGVFMTLIGAYRLRDGDLAPVRASTIKGRPGYFDYMPSDSDFASILVGRGWFVEAMKRNGLDGHHAVFHDPVRGDSSDWFIGVKSTNPAPDFQPAAPAIAQDQPRHEPVAIRSDERSESGAPTIAYTAPIKGNSDVKSIRVALSVPTTASQFLNYEFAEHVRDAKTRAATDTVIMTGTDALAISHDLGKNWQRLPLPRQDGLRLWNCFTTASGRHLVQTLGWQGPASGPANPERQGVILTLDAEGRLVGRSSPSLANWHGTASIDEANGVVAFGDYHANIERYASDFEGKRDEYLKTLMPNAVWRSSDGGESWSKAMEFGPLEIRHFHTVQADPHQRQVWWASSGDTWWESRIWRSADNGATWTDWTNTDPNVRLYYSDYDKRYNQACQRFTDMAIEPGRMIWGSDDFLGPFDKYDSRIPRHKRAGSRLFCSSKMGVTAAPVEIGFVGMPIRKLIDAGPGWIVVTEAKYRAVGLKPQVFFLGRKNFDLTYLFDVDNHAEIPTGFTFSQASTAARNGVFFSHRAAMDVFPGGVRCLRWQVSFE